MLGSKSSTGDVHVEDELGIKIGLSRAWLATTPPEITFYYIVKMIK